jgi:hypothetical protein
MSRPRISPPIGKVVQRSEEDEFQSFVEYVSMFYLPHDRQVLYPLHKNGEPLSLTLLTEVCRRFKKSQELVFKDFVGDSHDREQVRSMLESMGFREVPVKR